jgi:alpha-N-arabinofuranosidase
MRRTGLILACAALCGLAHGVEFTLGVGAYEGRAAFKQLRIVDASGKEVYSNDFASPDSVKGWIPAGRGEWKCGGGTLEQTFNGLGREAATLSIPRKFRNVTITMKAMRVDGKEGFIVPTGKINVSGGGEWVIFGGWGNTSHGIEQPPFAHRTTPGSIEKGRWYDVKVECADDRIRAWLDGELVMESSAPVDTSTRPAAVAPVKNAKTRKYNPMIFGHFIEHFDTQVYGGIFWPQHPLSDEDGFRKDVIEALRDIKCPIVRWPGGCYVSDYHWKCGVGPNRQPMWNKAWAVEDPNTFGTDEYVKWCRKVGCEPYICTNAGTGNEEEMSDWVEYCNLNIGKWGRQRIANGYEKPHDVMYWSVGNENWGGHEIGAKTVEQWGPLARESAKMMRGTDRRIKLLAAALPAESWTLPLLKAAGRLLDYVSIHDYFVWGRGDTPYLDCMMRTEAPEADIQRTIKTLEKAGFGGGRIGIAFDEWNLRGWYHPGLGNFRRGAVMNYKERRQNDVASYYTMADALFSACFLNTCLRHCDIVKMANFSPIVNTRGAVFVHDKGIVKRTSYHVFWMYTHLLEANISPVKVDCEALTNGKARVPVLDAVLTVSNDGRRRVLAVVNKSPDKSVSLDVAALGVKSGSLKATVLAGASPNDFNDIGAENRVVPVKTAYAAKDGKVELPAHSLSCIVIAE